MKKLNSGSNWQIVFFALVFVSSTAYILFQLFPNILPKGTGTPESVKEIAAPAPTQTYGESEQITGENGRLRVNYQNPQSLQKGIFSLEFPSNWALKSTVFYDSNENKMAELQGMNWSKEQTFCFQDVEKDSQGRLSVLRKNQITINGNEITEVVLSAYPEGSKDFKVWSPHVYCIEHEDRYFTITFYSIQDTGLDESDFRSILSTASFIQN